MRHAITTLLLAALLATLAAPALAELKVGDKPAIAFKTIDGKTIDNPSLKGWVTIVYFWETDDKYTLDSLDKLVPKFDAYGRRGVKLIAYNLNRDLKDVEKVVAKTKLNWTIVNDGQGWKSPIVTTWDFDRASTVFILSPEGQLLWRGHISAMDGPMEDAMRDHPPVLTREIKTELVNKQIKEIIRLLEENKNSQDFREPLNQLGNIQSPPLEDPETMVLVKKMLTYFDSKKEQDANSLKGYLQTYPAGAKMLETLRAALATATSQPGANLNPAVVAQNKKREQLAQTKLAAADALRDGGKEIPAFKAYKQITTAFTGTPAAKTALERVKTYEADAAFMAKLKKTQDDDSAQGLLQMGNSYRDSGRTDLARETYEKVIKEYPDAPAAAAAREALNKK